MGGRLGGVPRDWASTIPHGAVCLKQGKLVEDDVLAKQDSTIFARVVFLPYGSTA